MKRLCVSVILGLFLLAGPAPAQQTGATYRVGVDGLSCPFCAYGIEKHLSAIDGVTSAITDIGASVVIVRMRVGAQLAEDAGARAAREAGFKMRSFARAPGK